MHWLRNTWYQVGWSSELEQGEMLSRTVIGIPLVLFRQSNGAVSALLDQCPHRFAPLSMGRLDGDMLVCGYHGLGFEGSGRCALNPHGEISKGLKVGSFPVVEKDTVIWVWLGESEAELDAVPDSSFIEAAPEHGRIYGYMPTKANYQLLTDNILDLSHADYLHPTTLGGMMTNSQFSIEQQGESFVLKWDSEDQAVPGAFAPEIPPPQTGDFSIRVEWHAPARMILHMAAKPHSERGEFTPQSYSPTLHNMTPETETSTHYFYCATRPVNTPPPEVMALITESIEHAFVAEDKPILEKQQERIGNRDFWSLKPRMLSVDTGPVQVRRLLDEMIEKEQAQSGA